MIVDFWVAVGAWEVNNNGELKDDASPLIQTRPFDYPCTPEIQRFKIKVNIPYTEQFPVKEAVAIKVEKAKE